jgi:tetratricopeptide (TPR) repeat protein
LDREYAYQHLPEEPAADENEKGYTRRNLELRAAEYYASLRKPKSAWQTFDDLAPQLAEFEHLIRGRDFEQAALLLRSIDFNYLFLWSNFSLIISLRKRLGTALKPSTQAYNLLSLGRCFHNLDRIHEAKDTYLEALEMAEGMGNSYLMSACLGNLGNAYRALGQFEKAISTYDRAMSIAQVIGHRRGEVTWLGNQGNTFRALGYYERACQILEQVIEKAQQLGDLRRQCFALGDLGHTYFSLGKFDSAAECFEEGERMALQMQFRLGGSFCILMLSRIFLSQQTLDEVERCCVEGLDLGVATYINEFLLVNGILELFRKRYQRAQELFIQSMDECQKQLEFTEEDYHTRYTLAAAFTGELVSRSRMRAEEIRCHMLTPAIEAYQSAMRITTAPGVVSDVLFDLKLMRAAGPEGEDLEPLLDLLRNATYVPDVI